MTDEQLRHINFIAAQFHVLGKAVGDYAQIVPDLVDAAAGKIPHAYQGLCPDETNDYNVVDATCPACQAILAAMDTVRAVRAAIANLESQRP